MKVYFISGLGADRRVFKNIRLPHSFEPQYLEWIPPLPHESLEAYALRLAAAIDQDQPFGLVGLSMGGMMASAIACVLQPRFTVLISSVPQSHCLPVHYRLLAALRLHKIVPVSLLQKASIFKRLFTAEASEDKKLLSVMIRESDPRFIRWAMTAVLEWKHSQLPPNLIHIHGTADFILPCWRTNPQYKIRSAGHLMVVNRANEINEILEKELGRFGG